MRFVSFVSLFITAAAAAVSVARPSSAHLLDLPPLPQPPPLQFQRSRPAEVCFVVRTHRKHGEASEEGGGEERRRLSPLPPPIARLLRSLAAQTSPSWRALLLVADEDPFLDLEEVMERALGPRDDRAWVWARSSGPEHRAKEVPPPSASSSSPPPSSSAASPSSSPPRRHWIRGFHRRLFSLTDDAVQLGCPQSAELVVVTNGDNAYAPRFVERALEEARGGVGSDGGGGSGSGENEEREASPQLPADLVLFDYASRYARPTGVPCERFGVIVASEGGGDEVGKEGRKGGGGSKSRNSSTTASSPLLVLPYCKRNLGRWCHTDLGAVAFRLLRLRGRGGGGNDEAPLSASASSSSGAHSSSSSSRRRRHRFSDREMLSAAENRGLSSDSLDGVFVESLIQSGEWAVRRVGSGREGSRDDPWRGGKGGEGETKNDGDVGSDGEKSPPPSPPPFRSHECFFDHAPSPHACALSGGVWDDSWAATAEGAGGECLAEAEAGKRLRDSAAAAAALASSRLPLELELVSVRVLAQEGAPPLRCLRWRDGEGHRRAMRAFFGGRCEESKPRGRSESTARKDALR